MEGWATGQYTAAFDVEMIAKNAGATGACSILEIIRDMDENEILEDESDAE